MGATANSPQYELEADYYMALTLEHAGIDLEHGKALLVRVARASRDSENSEQGRWGVNARHMVTTQRMVLASRDGSRFQMRWRGVA